MCVCDYLFLNRAILNTHDYNGRAAKTNFYLYIQRAHTCCDDFPKNSSAVYFYTVRCQVEIRSPVKKKKKSLLRFIRPKKYISFFVSFFQDERLKCADEKSLSEHLKLPIQRINDYQLLLKVSVKKKMDFRPKNVRSR